VIERKISDDLSATLDYSNGGAVTGDGITTWQNLAQALKQSWATIHGDQGFRLCARVRHTLDWPRINGPAENAISTVDAFNASPGQADLT